MNLGDSKTPILLRKKALDHYPQSSETGNLFVHPSRCVPVLIHEKRNHLALKLRRIRDFISLLLSYPMRSVHDSKLKAWTHPSNPFYQRDPLTMDLYLLSRDNNPLRYLEGLIPKEILMNVEEGGSSIFADVYGIPDAIFNLATDLAVHQLIHTLLSQDDHFRKIHHIMLSTRNGMEKRAVMRKIEAALKDKDNVLRVKETFSEVLLIDASMYRSHEEVHIRQEMAQQLHIPVTEEDHLQGNDARLITTMIRYVLSRRKYLVLLVDGDAEEPLDLEEVGFPKDKHGGVVVLITTESSKHGNDELTMLMDLKIGTKYHLLPWEVFCHTIGNELVRSSNAIQIFAEHIVEECGSHLLVNLLVPNSLKNVEDIQLWELALDKLHWLHPSYDVNTFYGQSQVMVNAFLNFIWDGMNKIQKQCLTCSLFIPKIKDRRLDNEVIDNWISSLSMDATEANDNLRELVDHSILLQFEGTTRQYVQMPKDIYAILQSLNTQNPLFVKKVGLGLTELKNSELWLNAVYVELANSELSELPLSPKCLELKVLILQNNVDLTKCHLIFSSKCHYFALWIYPIQV